MAREFSVKTIYEGTAAANGSSYALDYRSDQGETERIVAATMNGSDTITVQASLDETTWFTLDTFSGTSDFYVVSGPWPYLRAVKAGTTASATVKLVG